MERWNDTIEHNPGDPSATCTINMMAGFVNCDIHMVTKTYCEQVKC
jgi:hypothetical protein